MMMLVIRWEGADRNGEPSKVDEYRNLIFSSEGFSVGLFVPSWKT